ncbi:hypothetical protein BC829DRAFT_160956 [Chytridium lagenaria]|nr:hypothetical protein BC829DRAFT_160956 [Chytridium lagenaria]
MSDIRPPPGGYAPPPPPDRGGSGVGRGRGAGPQRANSFQTYAQPAYHMMPTTSYQVYPQSYNPYPQYYPQDYYQQQWAAPTLHYNPSSGFQPSVAPYPQQVISSTLPPKPSTNFSCDACEQDFSTQHKYQNHIASHQKCPQCDFVASKKVLYVHKDEAHGAGRIIAKNESPEEVAKWIAERKRNYPTDANIAKKKENDRNRQDIGMLERDDNQPGSKKRKRTKPEAPPVENLNGLGMVDAYASSDDGSSDGCEMEAEAPAEGSAKLP